MSNLIRCTCVLVAILVGFQNGTSNAQENVVIVLDDSGSMNQRMRSGTTRIDAAKKAIGAVIKQFPDSTQLGLYLLNGAASKQHWAVPLHHLSKTESAKVINTLDADGGTPLGERIREAADALLKLREKQIYGNYRLLIVTDGEANDARQLAAYLPDVLSRGILVDAIGVDMHQDHSLATRVHSYRRADDDAALAKAVQEVFAERSEGSLADDQDYALLQALDNETAKEALKLLSKPNNAPIVGMKQPEAWSPHANTVAIKSSSWGGILGTLCFGLVTCMLLVFLMVLMISLFFSLVKRH